nr:LOW QUALITY PROTEIN: tripartite motif-containing protein 29-like [Salvelinus alpinus]
MVEKLRKTGLQAAPPPTLCYVDLEMWRVMSALGPEAESPHVLSGVSGLLLCPQCRQTFIPRPVLKRSTVLAEVVEKLKKIGLQAAPPPALCYAGPGDVACDVCTGTRKQKALMSCLACLASYCETHLHPHYESPALKKHKLVKATAQLQEKICSHHDKLLEVYCRTDQQCICYQCVMDEHKGHDTVSAAAERTEKQRQLGMSQQKVQQRFQEREGAEGAPTGCGVFQGEYC